MHLLIRLRACLVLAFLSLALPLDATVLQDLKVEGDKDGLVVTLRADGEASYKASALHHPERILVIIKGATLKGSKLKASTPWGKGMLKGVRLADKGPKECWAILDLAKAVPFKASDAEEGAFEVLLGAGNKAVLEPLAGAIEPLVAEDKMLRVSTPQKVAQALSVLAEVKESSAAPVAPLSGKTPAPVPSGKAKLPLINLMFFDVNVNYQGKHYERYPCANLIYTPTDSFPLSRDFSSVLVFHHGFGAFSGTARILDPSGQSLAFTEAPFSFNLYNPLSDAMVDLPWKLLFKDKGVYTLVLALNGQDVMTHQFYVGHNTDNPAPPAK